MSWSELTYDRHEDGDELGEPDGAGGRHDPDVDEHVREVQDDQGSEEPEPVPCSAQIN